MMMHKQYREQISDYVLGLLDSAEVVAFEAHLAACPECQAQLQRERRIGQSVRGTLTNLPTPTHARMMQLMPPAPAPRLSLAEGWQRTVALVVAFVTLIAANLGLQLNERLTPIASPVPAYVVQTATATGMPTATATRLAYTTPTGTPVPVMSGQ